MRKLASIRRIGDIRVIPDADSICAYVVDGWTIVDAKNKYNKNDLVIMCEIDSWIPHEMAPFLSKGQEPREFDGIRGERLRTVKLRGQLSQGLLMPLSILPDSSNRYIWVEGVDVTELLGIVKYDPPIPACLAGVVKGPWPSVVPKTDQERIQNLAADLEVWKARGLTFEVTEKLDGSSGTFFMTPEGELLVCSRNLNLTKTEGNSFWRIAEKYSLETSMKEHMNGYAIQGELIGEGIQGNKYGLKGQDLRVFDVFNTYTGKQLSMNERHAVVSFLGMRSVPVLDECFSLTGHTMDTLLAYAVSKSVLKDTQREGVVFKCIEDPSISFKVISDLFLVKEK